MGFKSITGQHQWNSAVQISSGRLDFEAVMNNLWLKMLPQLLLIGERDRKRDETDSYCLFHMTHQLKGCNYNRQEL